MALLVTLLFYIHLLHSLTGVHVFHKGVIISYNAQFLTECRSETDVFRRILGEDLQHCIKQCKLRAHCKSVSYRRRIRVCDLFTSRWDGESLGTGDCIYVAKPGINGTEVNSFSLLSILNVLDLV